MGHSEAVLLAEESGYIHKDSSLSLRMTNEGMMLVLNESIDEFTSAMCGFKKSRGASFTTLCSEYRKRLAINTGKTPFLRRKDFPTE